jgi:N-acetylglutamate synthase-like GNAT family acetyltransferase
MGFAHFNARRTSAAPDDTLIQRGTTDAFEYVLDPGRPASTYYNRAVGRSPDAVSRDALRALPNGIVGLETTPGQLTPETSALLSELGFQPVYPLCYLGLVPTGRLAVTREVRRLDASQVEQFFDLLQLEGVEFPAEKRARKRGFYCTEQFQTYVAYDAANTACGWTTMYVEGKVAFFGNSFTLPQYRRAGAHSALLAARLNAAAEMNLEAAYTDVESGSQSHANCERAGFRTLTINLIWRRA